MKKIVECSFAESPEYLCYPFIAFPYSILKGNDDVEQHKKWLSTKYINCSFRETSQRHKFLISIYDNWSASQKRISYQLIEFNKESTRRLFNIPLLIKKALLEKTYPQGQCAEKFFTGKESTNMLDYIITGYNDINRTFHLHGITIDGAAINQDISYADFVNFIFETPKQNLLINLWRYNPVVNQSKYPLKSICFDLNDYIQSQNSKHQSINNQVFGLSACEALARYVPKDDSDAEDLRGRHIKSFFGHKQVMFERIGFFHEMQLVPGELVSIAENIRNIAGESLNCYLNGEKEKASEFILKTIQIEKEYLPNVLGSISEKTLF